MSRGPIIVDFIVPGIPRPQGSKVGFVTDAGKVRMREDAQGVEAWRADIRLLAKAKMRGKLPVNIPVDVQLAFCFKGGPLGWKATKPDIDKLCRAVLDALGSTKVAPAGVVFSDDCQVVALSATKVYAATDCAIITVRAADA